MNICTDSIRLANQWFSPSPHWESGLTDQIAAEFGQVARQLLRQDSTAHALIDSPEPWRHMILAGHAEHSQFDTLVNVMRRGETLPDGLVCLAGSGEGFHGQRGRNWAALSGNIHLSIFLSPGRDLNEIDAGLTVLPAVSLVQTLDTIAGLENRSGIKWVNDILIDGSKAAGFLVHTQSSAGRVTGAVIGIGLNVETIPSVAPTKFVPSVTAVCNHVSDPLECRLPLILRRLLHVLGQNYEKLVHGHGVELLEFYRERSLIMGNDVRIYEDSQGLQDVEEDDRRKVAAGRVVSIGNNLELFLEGRHLPVFQGRLIMESDATPGIEAEGVQHECT